MAAVRAAGAGLTFAVTGCAAFMAALDNLVVTTALPTIRADLDAGLDELEWTVNAYTLAFAVFLLTAAAIGDRFGRKPTFLTGIAVFTVASAGAALATSPGALVAARAVQGLGAAVLLPLSLTLLVGAVVQFGSWEAIFCVSAASSTGTRRWTRTGTRARTRTDRRRCTSPRWGSG
jgi:MFS family permease